MSLRRLIAGFAAVALAGILAVAPQLSSAQSNPAWLTFQGSSTRTGTSTVSGPTGGTSNHWTLPKPVESSPVVDASGNAYVGDDDGNVYAFSPGSLSAPKWIFKTGDQVTGTPTLSPDGTTLFVASNDGSVYALKAADGSKLWATNTAGILQSSPVVSSDGSTVYVALAAGSIKALSSKDGSVQWTAPVAGSIPGSLSLSPDGTTIYAATYTSILYGIPAGGPKSGTTNPYYLDGPALSSPAVDSAGNIYVTTGQGSLMSFTPGTSTARWTFTVANHIGAQSTPAIWNGTVFFGDANQNFYAVSASTGQQVWSVHTGGAIRSSPVVAAGNGIVYFGSDDGNVYALKALDGTRVWLKATGAAVTSSPALGPDGSLWIGSQANTVYRFVDISPPPAPGATATPGHGPSPTVTATLPPGPSPTPVVGTLAFTLKGPIKVGAKQTITIHAPAGTAVHIRVDYPNGDHQSHGALAGTSGLAVYSYKQGASKITHNKFYAHVTVRTDAGASVTHSYKILFGSIDVSVEPRQQAVGGKLNVWVHTAAHTRVAAYLLFPNGKFSKLNGATNGKGWAHMTYKVGRNLTTASSRKVVVTARVTSKNLTTKTFFMIK